jgi:hypothetical protein
MMAAGLRATAKVVEHPPEPKVGAPVLDPTVNGGSGHLADPRKIEQSWGLLYSSQHD